MGRVMNGVYAQKATYMKEALCNLYNTVKTNYDKLQASGYSLSIFSKPHRTGKQIESA
jgi:hypothetical protein